MTQADRDVGIVWGGRQAGGGGNARGEVRKGSGPLIKHYSAVINMLPSQLRATGLSRTNATDSSSTLGLLPLHTVALT